MMRLFGYVLRRLMPGIVWVWVLLLIVDVTFALLGDLAAAGRPSFLRQWALQLPGRAYELFPMACLIGGLWRIGELAANHELIAARIAGVSPARLAGWALAAGVLLTLPALWVGEGVAPDAGYRASLLRVGGDRPDLGVEPDREIWVRDGSRLIGIGAIVAPGLLADVQVIEFGPERDVKTLTAAGTARRERDGWYLEAVSRTRFEGERVVAAQVGRERWDQPPDPALIQVLTREPGQMSLPDLGRYLVHLEASGVAPGRFALSFWARLARPVSAWVMLLLGLVLVLSTPLPWSTAPRLLAGVLIGLGFRLLSDTAAHAGLVYGLPPALAAWLPTTLAALLVAALFARAR